MRVVTHYCPHHHRLAAADDLFLVKVTFEASLPLLPLAMGALMLLLLVGLWEKANAIVKGI